MEGSGNGRPAKRMRTESSGDKSEKQSKSKGAPKWRAHQIEYKRQKRRAEIDHPQPESSEHRRDRELFGIDEDDDNEIGLKPLQDEEKEKLKKLHFPKMFSQPSVIANGDKGIFVSCDKGKEKKCLTELADLVDDYLVERKFVPAELIDPDAQLQSRLNRQKKKSATISVDNEDSPVEEEEIDIESSVNAEVAAMQVPYTSKNPAVKVRAFQLITLDIPCISFLRFLPSNPAHKRIDPVDLVHSICADIAKNPGKMRSRYIKRLSPIVWMGKVLSGGLERACKEVLPSQFELEKDPDKVQAVDNGVDRMEQTHGEPTTFAIRPTTRQNDKVSRDDVIRQIAEKVQELGSGKHKVDLKGYKKGILVEIYKGWIGMSVVDNAATQPTGEQKAAGKVGYEFGYEALKRFNLAEIYAEGLKNREDEKAKARDSASAT